jgi:hypothetical protein
MTGTGLKALLDGGEDLFSSLERETLACLKNLESMSVKEIVRFAEKRQETLDAIQKFGTQFMAGLDRPEWSGEKDVWEEFRQRETALLRRVIEMDGLLLALAEKELSLFKAKLAVISQGRRALRGYREEGRRLPSSLKRMA